MRLQGTIDRYNAGSSSADIYFDELIREGLTEEELELFDLIKKDKMTKEGDAESPPCSEVIAASPA